MADAAVVPPSRLTDSTSLEDDVSDEDVALQRYNSQLPPVYRSQLDAEHKLFIRALHVLASSILSATHHPSQQHPPTHPTHPAHDSSDDDPIVSEAYDNVLERDLASLEKGITKYLDLKHIFTHPQFSLFFKIVLRAALSPSIDLGLRSKLARCAARILSKRQCHLAEGVDWRPIMHQLITIHIHCVDGGPYIGRDIRDSHCRNIVSLLTKCRNYLTPHDNAQRIWNEFSPRLCTKDFDANFQQLLLMVHVLPTRGQSCSDWFDQAMQIWKSVTSSSDWDSVWMGLFSRLSRQQPCSRDFVPHLSWIYTRVVTAFRLPLGGLVPEGAVDRRCPHECYFLMEGKTIPSAASLIVSSLSPRHPETLQYLERLFALIANYFHPSNSGRWSPAIGSFLVHVSANLAVRVCDERNARKAGVKDRVFSDKVQHGIAPEDDRLPDHYIEKLVHLMMPLVQHGLHSKVSVLSFQCASASRDLALILPDTVVEPLLMQAAEGLSSLSSPHRTTAALKLLAAMTPVFLDPELFPNGADFLQQALELTLPGIDANDPNKTESTLRFIAAASARLQSTLPADNMSAIADFMEDYIRQVLDRLFDFLEALEAPPKKSRGGGGTQISYFIFSVAIENLFAALPGKLAISASQRVARQLTGAACMNGMKFYGALVRAAASTAAVAQGGSSVNVFVPTLLDSLLDEQKTSDGGREEVLVTIGDDEIVWRIRMLAQACRAVGSGLEHHLKRISSVIRLAFDSPKRPVYKAGGRLLRGVLEGLTSIQMAAGGSEDDSTESPDGEILYNFEWRQPSSEEWKHAEQLILEFVSHAEELCGTTEESDYTSVTTDRDVLFRVLRLLHALQRGGRWIFGGALPKTYKDLDRFVSGSKEMTKREAKLALKRPIAAGLGGERTDEGSEEFTTKVWIRIYSLISKIISQVSLCRPDDGALLYRCLEPIELASEPFRRGDRSRQTMQASRAYKSAYKPIVIAKRPFGAYGGIGRAMPRFIVKLRIEAHHEMRLSIGARGGLTAAPLCEELITQLTDLSLNDFRKVRGEARGVLTRALRIVRPRVRRIETLRIVEVLRSSVSKETAGLNDTPSLEGATLSPMVDEGEEQNPKNDRNDIKYEKMLGAAAVLRSTAISPLMMRDWSLFTTIMQALVEVMPNAERLDGMHAVTGLFAKLSALFRPLALDQVRMVGDDLRTVDDSGVCKAETEDGAQRVAAYEGLTAFLLTALEKDNEQQLNGTENGRVETGAGSSEKKAEAHWRLQVLVGTLLYMTLREDREPPAAVAQFFVDGMLSDVLTLRQISAKGVVLMLALYGRKAGRKDTQGSQFDSSSEAWASIGKEAVAIIGKAVSGHEFVQKLMETLARDHDDGSEGSVPTHFGIINDIGGAVAFANISRTIDGNASWMIANGPQWPNSWSTRARDNLDIVRMRFYESLSRVFGLNFVHAVLPALADWIKKVQEKKEKIITGVKDEDIKVLAAEILASVCRGMDLEPALPLSIAQVFSDLVKSLLNELSGPVGRLNGATLLRLINTADTFTIGIEVREKTLDWLLERKPLVVPMDGGPFAHQQASHLRYIQSCMADVEDPTDTRVIRSAEHAIPQLMDVVAFAHEMKTVREEVARCLALIAVDIPASCQEEFEKHFFSLIERMRLFAKEEEEEQASEEDDGVLDTKRKSRSRQGETLSRFVSFVFWSGRGKGFEKYVSIVMPALFACFNDSDPERIYFARMTLSLIALGSYSQSVTEDIIGAAERIAEDPRWKVRGSVLPFAQVFSFTSLFSATSESLRRMRNIVIKLLSDRQLEIRQHAAGAFVPMIRDSAPEAVEEVRSKCMQVLAETRPKGRGSKRVPLDSETMRKRHGAVLGLSSMVVSSPYAIPSWMPSVLVGLSGCVNDGPPVSTGVRKLFADFMRTHRDEWASHKLAFTPDELEIVSELLVSPSYYA